jgi:WD40 repeat protein
MSTVTPSITPAPTGTVSQSDTIDSENAASLRTVSTGKLEPAFQSMQWRADGQAVFIATRQAAFVLEAAKDNLTQVLAVPEPAHLLDISSDGKAAVANDTRTISLIDSGPDTVLKTLTIDGEVTSAHFSSDGKVLAVMLADRIEAQLWDVNQGAKVESLTGFETAAPVYSVEFDSTGRSLIWSSRAKAQVMDLITAQLSLPIMEADFIAAIDLSPVEKVRATAAGAELTLWDLESADNLDVFELPNFATDMAFSPDGKLLFVATDDGVMGLTLPLLEPVADIKGAVQGVAFSLDGSSFASVSKDGVVSIYRPGP